MKYTPIIITRIGVTVFEVYVSLKVYSMENEQKTLQIKIYMPHMIFIASYLGGLLVAALLMADNFILFNNKRIILWLWIVSILLSIAMFFCCIEN